jgi:2-C-methyl-D-erythritol 4-phosphate cytidylyltransferase
MNTGIILAAGNSTRFNHKAPKQLYKINGKTILTHSVNALSELDEIIIVTNSKCAKTIKSPPISTNVKRRTIIVVNDKDCRLASIKAALKITDKHTQNIIIHDAARPYIDTTHIKTLIKSSKTYAYSQYCLKLTNGLIKKNADNIECLDRDQYMELCTPLIVDYNLFNFIFKTYIDKPNREHYEALSVIDSFKIPYNLIEGSYKHLRKITTLDDIY